MITDVESMFKEQSPWPPVSEAARIQEITVNRKLRDSDHEQLWKDESRKARDDKEGDIQIILNYPWLVTKKTTDTLLGTPPLIYSGEEDIEDPADVYLEDLIKDTGFYQVLREVCYDVSSFGEGIIKVRLEEETVKIESNSPDIWYPVVKPGSIREITHQVLAFKLVQDKTEYLKVEIHTPGQIEHRLYELSSPLHQSLATVVGKQVDLSTIPAFEDLEETQTYEPKEFLVIPVYNQRCSDQIYGISDYGKDLKTVIKSLEKSISRKQQILETFTNPSIVGPRTLMDYDPVAKKQRFIPGRYYGINTDPGETPFIPQPIVWDAHLGELQDQIQELKEQFYALAELPPAALASALAGTAESGTALRLRMTPLVSKINRFKEEFEPGIIKSLQLAAALDGKAGLLDKISVKWQDSLPKIPLEEAQRMGILKQNEIISRKAALIELGYDSQKAELIALDAANEGGL